MINEVTSLKLEKDKQMLCISSNEHYLAAGIDCYNKAVNKLVDSRKQDLALKLCVEVCCCKITSVQFCSLLLPDDLYAGSLIALCLFDSDSSQCNI